MAKTLEFWKLRLVLSKLAGIETELHYLVFREADQCSTLVEDAGFPCLLFPCLFEERLAGALERQARQVERYWDGLRAGDGATLEFCETAS